MNSTYSSYVKAIHSKNRDEYIYFRDQLRKEMENIDYILLGETTHQKTLNSIFNVMMEVNMLNHEIERQDKDYIKLLQDVRRS
jgi:hypothetical protein